MINVLIYRPDKWQKLDERLLYFPDGKPYKQEPKHEHPLDKIKKEKITDTWIEVFR